MTGMPDSAGGEQLLLDLLSVPGIADAELSPDDSGPMGVRIRLAAGTAAGEVQQAVRDVLDQHGLRARVSPAAPETPPAPASPHGRDPGSTTSPAPASMPPPPPGAPGRVLPFRDRNVTADISSGKRPREGLGRGLDALLGPPPTAPAPPPRREPTTEHITGVAVEETSDGVMVAVKTSTGRAAARRARLRDGDLNEAVVAAVASLMYADPPRIVVVEEGKLDGCAVMSVLLEHIDGERKAGSAIVENGPAFAVARAVWAALTGS